MNLKEIKEKIQPGEIARLKCGAIGDLEYSYEEFKFPDAGKALSFESAVRDDWEIVRIKNHVLTVEEHIESLEGKGSCDCQRCWVQGNRLGFRVGRKNGRLERDLELRPAIEDIKLSLTLIDSNTYLDYTDIICNVIKNIPPL